MYSYGKASTHVGGRDGVPLPKVAAAPTGFVGWTICHCGLKHRPGVYHLCIDLETPEPIAPPKPKPSRKAKKPQKSPSVVSSNRCACGAPIGPRSRRCAPCFDLSRVTAKCGTVSGYERHRRLAQRDPANNPWPLPDSNACGCLAAHLAKRGRTNYGAIKARLEEATERYEAGETIRTLAEDFGVSIGGLRSALKESGVKIRPAAEVNRGRKFPHRRALSDERVAEVIEAYQSGMTQVRVAEKFGVSETVVVRTLQEAGIAARRLGRRPKGTGAAA